MLMTDSTFRPALVDLASAEMRAMANAGHYGAGMIDPPWHHKTRSAKGIGTRHPSAHYRTMSLTEISALPVREVMGRNAWVFLWTTWPHLREAFTVAEAWGLTYSSMAFTWVKLNPKAVDTIWMTTRDFHMGTGFTTRKNSEPCLLFKVGRPKIARRDVRELLIAARRKHSQKPDEAYSRVERFCAGPYADIFSRQVRPGWDCFGDETDHFEVAQPRRVRTMIEAPVGPMPLTPLFPKETA